MKKTSEELLAMPYNDLLKLAKETGAFNGLKKRDDLIKAILEKQEETPEEEVKPTEKIATISKVKEPVKEWAEGDQREFKDGTYTLTKVTVAGVDKLSWKKNK